MNSIDRSNTGGDNEGCQKLQALRNGVRKDRGQSSRASFMCHKCFAGVKLCKTSDLRRPDRPDRVYKPSLIIRDDDRPDG